MKKTLFDILGDLPDPRTGNGIRHKLNDVLTIAVLAILCDCRTYAEFELFGKVREEWLRTFLELPNGTPSHDTFGDIIAALNPRHLHQAFREWIDTIREKISDEVIAIDGKTARGSQDKANGKRPLHVVSAWANENQLILGQLAVNQKSNEITAIPELLKMLYLKGCIVTIDAMGTQKEIATTIIDAEAHYVLQVKGNQKTLLDEMELYLKEEVLTQSKVQLKSTNQYAQTKEKGHGRIETRTCYVTEHIEWLTGKDDWKNLSGIGLIQSERLIGDHKTVEHSFFIYSQKGATAEQLLKARRSHWEIENKLHWTLDTAFGEDESRVRSGNGAENLNVLRQLALNLVKKETSLKASMRMKLKCCGLDPKYLIKVLQVSPD
jgi:predicted transposase YbfD/YdcC